MALYLHSMQIIKIYDMALNNIKSALAKTNKTSKWLAEKLNKNVATISRWNQNTNQPDLYTLKEISILLEIDVRQLIN